MGYQTKIEAAIKLGYSVELIEYFLKNCPKSGETRKLIAIDSPQGSLIDENELLDFQRYLNKPWPLPPKGTRPNIPNAIRDDIKRESHFGCAICGLMDNGEIAHIHDVAETLNNSPDNLIYLCPNHHTKYDLGFKLSSNITIDEVIDAKKVKSRSRVRSLRYEANAQKYLKSVIELVAKLESDLKKDLSVTHRAINVTELDALLKSLPEIISKAEKSAAADTDITGIDKELERIAPSLMRATSGTNASKTEADIRKSAREVISSSNNVFLDIDEVECPHCLGNGQRGLVGTLCSFCGGSCFVSNATAESYDPSDIDEENCPRCGGRGQTGLVGDICAYCKGNGYVTHDEHEDYDEADIDEVPCPHCNGSGKYGWNDTLCVFCGGSCFISKESFQEYDREKIDEVNCPRCGGSGQTGLVGDPCSYCRGDCFVTQEEFDNYDEDDLDEVDCPHCNGRGKYGWSGSLCSYCGGSCFVSSENAREYDPDDIDEVNCPRCGGSGQTGLVGNLCALCKGDCVVSEEKRDLYIKTYGS